MHFRTGYHISTTTSSSPTETDRPMNSITRILTLVAIAVSAATVASARTYRLPGQHTKQTNDLLANQASASHSISIEPTIDYLNFSTEDEPEGDIYEEGWNSNRVNCYANVKVPDRAVIDVSEYCMPHDGPITSPYGYRRRFRRMHKGIDIGIHMGDTIYAAFDGRVRITNYERAGYGYYVVIRHTNDLETVYGHLSRFLVKPEQYVHAGDPIALGGNTGRSTGPHLHFETRYMGYAINPAGIFDFANQTTHTDTYTFSKSTYMNARNFSPAANAEYARGYNSMRSTNKATSTGSSKSSGTARTVKVKKGDTLSKIAARNHTTVARLCRANGIKATAKIRPGQKLKIK